MADGTPDISRIIKLIMDNPKIIDEIGDMMKSDSKAPKKLRPRKQRRSLSRRM